jgi:hypothetical protein
MGGEASSQIDSLLADFKLTDTLNSSFEFKRHQSPSYLRRTGRKLSQVTSPAEQIEDSALKAFRRRCCLYYQGMLPLKKLLTSSFIRKEHEAKVEAAQNKLKQKAIEKWLEFYISQYEAHYKPKRHFETALQRRVMGAWSKCVSDPLEAVAANFFMVRTRQLTFGARVFDAWVNQVRPSVS